MPELEKAWGLQFNLSPSYERLKRDQKPQGSPEWFNPYQTSLWQEKGLNVWNSTEKRMGLLSGHEALELLDKLVSQDSWKTEGISITRQVHKIQMQAPSRGRRKKTEPEATAAASETKTEMKYEEIVHLPPEVGAELIDLLQQNKQHLTEMAEQEKKRRDEAFRQIFNMLLKSHREREETGFDFKARAFEWERQSGGYWVCHHQQVEGSVRLQKNLFFWSAQAQYRGSVGKFDHFADLQQAVNWVEKEMVDLASQPPPPEPEPYCFPAEQREAARARLKQQLIGSPFWIKPTALEPERITYRVIVEVYAAPIGYKTMELSCGDILQYDKRYLSPAKLAAALSLDFDHFKIEQPVGVEFGWFLFESLTTYYQETAALEQAQKIWNQSTILRQFKDKKISRARYGYQEVETGFTVFLGSCEDPENPWEKMSTRHEYLEDQALRESICYSLDMNGFRDYLGLTARVSSDEATLISLHENRAQSKHLPAEVRQESRVWLAQREPIRTVKDQTIGHLVFF
jgi:hypothetical protein